MSFEEWRYVMSIHLDALFHLCHVFLPGMREQKWGRIIAISSDVCLASIPGLSHYTAAKAGVIGFVRGLASEIGEDGVTINAVAPGLVRTPGSLAGGREELGMFESYVARQAIKRTPTPDDVAGAVSFLVSDDAALITGQTLLVDGGWAFN
jgi:NAD(P)-dependent dehydrogenase (short-subunit alcohol dehydrogenase family)